MKSLLLSMSFNDIIDKADGWVWGWFLIILILATGIWLTVRTGFVQIFHLGKALKYTVKNEDDGEGDVTSFGALCTALSATIGTGNIVGVATAICLGGRGALLWMLIAAFFGMATKYAEGFLAIKYRDKKADGHYLGGPFCYIEKGMGSKWKWLAKLFAIFGICAGLMGIGTITQINGITSAVNGFFDPELKHIAFSIGENNYTYSTVIGGLIVTVFAALVIIGGIKRIAKVSGIIVPFMAVTYILFVLIIVISHIKEVPAAIADICKMAFSLKAVTGAGVGITLKLAMQKGIGRGIFSNEAGLGSAPIAAAAAKTKDTVRQGLVTMTGTFIDTIVICTLTGLSIVLTNADHAYVEGAVEGVNITSIAWQKGLPWNENISAFILMVCLAFFAFTTILGWNYYSERCIEYLTGNQKVVKAYRVIYIFAVLIGPYMTVSAVWGIADIFNGLMAFPNLIALFALSGVVGKETKEYFANKKKLK
ncbi:MAG: sodium:alanine symporter family protein [Acetobacter sp.]|nr:sodium:alanine symporter family protein [Bacteroides sp.]MCM1341480.1 sodium:alanine symporter family protein [Acetobacter sp.]MCM1434173.1 sodium:alanine symporter family protein [Clostridiales bacterium]